MTKTTKAAVVPYLSLINFANEVEITPSNWQVVLRRLWEDGVFPAPSPAASGRVSRPFGFAPPAFLDGERIAGPEPLRAVQRELQADLNRTTLKGKCFTPKISRHVSLRKSVGVKRWLPAFA